MYKLEISPTNILPYKFTKLVSGTFTESLLANHKPDLSIDQKFLLNLFISFLCCAQTVRIADAFSTTSVRFMVQLSSSMIPPFPWESLTEPDKPFLSVSRLGSPIYPVQAWECLIKGTPFQLVLTLGPTRENW